MNSERVFSICRVAGLLIAVVLMTSSPVFAQTKNPSPIAGAVSAKTIIQTQALSPSQRRRQGGIADLPWERDLKKYYQRRDRIIRGPAASTPRRAKKPAFDPYKVLGITRNRPVGLDPQQSLPEDPVFDPYVAGLDANGDSAVSKAEYFRKRLRFGAASNRLPGRNRRHIMRLDQQFRSADLNRDGKITADELQLSGQSRF